MSTQYELEKVSLQDPYLIYPVTCPLCEKYDEVPGSDLMYVDFNEGLSGNFDGYIQCVHCNSVYKFQS